MVCATRQLVIDTTGMSRVGNPVRIKSENAKQGHGEDRAGQNRALQQTAFSNGYKICRWADFKRHPKRENT
jgi:hypothetical protein